MTDLIRWEDNSFEGLGGYVLGTSTPFFAIVDRGNGTPLMLLSSLPGPRERLSSDEHDPVPLKAEAERLLREFAVSVLAADGPPCAACAALRIWLGSLHFAWTRDVLAKMTELEAGP